MEAAGPQCAVCRHLGKLQCDDACSLGLYFPIEKNEEFQCVHKVFSIASLKKIILSVEEDQRVKTVETLVLEAQMRLYDRVYGPITVNNMLEDAINNAQRELNIVNEQLRILRATQQPAQDDGPSTSDVKGKGKM